MSRKTYIDIRGYLKYCDDDHLVHRDIAYRKIYRDNRTDYPKKFRYYVIHHKNRKKVDNRVSNLRILRHNEHRKIHGIKVSPWIKIIEFFQGY